MNPGGENQTESDEEPEEEAEKAYCEACNGMSTRNTRMST